MKIRKMNGYLSLAVMVLAFAIFGECASVGNPGFLPEKGRYIMGFEYNSVKGGDLSDSKFGTRPLEPESKQSLAKIVYGLSDRLSILAKVGSSDLVLWNPNASTSYSHSSALGWGAGFRVIFYEDLGLGLSLGGGAQYFTFEPDKTNDNRTAELVQWDSSLFMCIMNRIADADSYVEPFRLTSTSFYTGARYSETQIDWTYGSSSGTLEADDNFGIFAGFDFVFDDNYIMGIEARFSDEKAYSAVLGFRF